MTDALHTLLAPFKRQLADLEQAHAAGTLSQTQRDAERASLERRLLDMLLHDNAVAAPTAAKPSWSLLLGLLVLVLAVAIGGYVYKRSANPQQGEEEGADGGANQAQVVAMVEQLAERMKQNPNDADGWAMLARSYSVMERNEDALAAYQKAVALRQDDAGLLVDYADALAVKNQHSLQGEPMALITRALKLNPDHIKGLALAGTDAFVRKDFALAVKYWSRIEQVGPPDNMLVQRVSASLQEARKLAGLPPQSTPLAAQTKPQAPADASPVTAGGPSVRGTVSLSPELRAQASPEDTVFIFAKAAPNGRMPLAAERKQVKDLPYQFTLDDSKSMSPQARLSSATQVVISARISKSGNAIAQPGDLQAQSAPVALGAKDLRIDIREVVKP
jgi:cytochrome c-type biogenesis protein CcmH